MSELEAAILLAGAGMALSVIMAVAWRVQQSTGQSGWIDTIWSFSVGTVGAALALWPGEDGLSLRQILVAALAAAWSLRLGASIARRTIKGGEDPRYAALYEQWGENYSRRLFWFLQIQAAAAFVLVATIAVAAHNPVTELRLADMAGAFVLAIAILGERLADNQLRDFRSNPANRGKVCETGLWAYSRHPNYFFEWLGWCAYPFFGINADLTYPIGFATLAGPVFMYWLLVHVSGIPLLEAHMLRSRGAQFEAYRSRVNAFFPGVRKGARS
ncbi:steroid 5-alpha reductase family enzyme [Microvirga flocculans]|uniref:Steroid 5-alpha reductase family enzyme n=1 Tax=Microvirga flocculans TaxID=217168 RepID=A0A7W6IGP6_9HYPH|nr:DUF1295 domain-containing protein [Microvirga flocculans]MBB4040484.1 steroid 5-alpha reductase family enzyme [Microvirga flocculans]